MGESGRTLSERVVATVAEALDQDPFELPPLERTISADALDYLFHRKNHPPGAYTVFPYCDLWVVAHSNGSVDVFDDYRATSIDEQLPDGLSEPSVDERMAVFQFRNERHVFYEDQFDALHRIVVGSDTSEDAWDSVVEFARERQA